MRIYVESFGSYRLLENAEGFHLGLFGENSRISLARLPDSNLSQVELVRGLDESTAKQAMEELLRLTGDGGEGVAVISWDGTRFTKRVL